MNLSTLWPQWYFSVNPFRYRCLFYCSWTFFNFIFLLDCVNTSFITPPSRWYIVSIYSTVSANNRNFPIQLVTFLRSLHSFHSQSLQNMCSQNCAISNHILCVNATITSSVRFRWAIASSIIFLPGRYVTNVPSIVFRSRRGVKFCTLIQCFC